MKKIILTIMLLLIFGQEKCSLSDSDTGAQRPVTQEARVPGIIDYSDDRTGDVVNAPSHVRPGQDFQVTITTFGIGAALGAVIGAIAGGGEGAAIGAAVGAGAGAGSVYITGRDDLELPNNTEFVLRASSPRTALTNR